MPTRMPTQHAHPACRPPPGLLRGEMARPDQIRFPGRILFLTEDEDLLRSQLEGESLPFERDRKLMSSISILSIDISHRRKDTVPIF